MARAETASPRIAERARIVLAAARGNENIDIAKRFGISSATVGLWRRRFAGQGVAGIARDAPRPGRPPRVDSATVEMVLRSTIGRRPPGADRWSARSLARDLGVSKSTVQRIWRSRGIDPRRPAETYPTVSKGDYLDRVTDLVGVYVDLPERAIALAADPRRRAGPLPRPERRALDSFRRRNRGAEFRSFLRTVERETPAGLDVHLLLDQRMAPTPVELDRWLLRHPRLHLHYLPADPRGESPIDRLLTEFARTRRRGRTTPAASHLYESVRAHLGRGPGGASPLVWVADRREVRGPTGRPVII